MSDRADNAGAQVEVDDLHKVRAIFRTSDYSGAQAELEAALRDVDESVFAERTSAHGHECAALHEALTSDTPVSSLGARPRAWEPEIANDCFRPRKSAFEGRSLVGPGGDSSKPLKSTGRGLAHRVDDCSWSTAANH